MKILHTVESYPPSVGGMQEVVRQLSERLSGFGHEVTVATRRDARRQKWRIKGVNVVEFNITGSMACGFSGDVDKYSRFLLNSQYDIVTNFAAQQWATDIALPLLDRIHGKKVFVPTGFSGLHRPEFREYFQSMPTWMTKYDMNIFLSENYLDISFAMECGVKNLVVIPNGASRDEFLGDAGLDIRALIGIPRDHFLILHVGSHTGAKGHREVFEIFRTARVRKATLLMVANGCVEEGCMDSCRRSAFQFGISPVRLLDGKRFINLSMSREETVAAYKAADIFLFPSNIECSPIVLFECMASKTPFLTTDVGNAKEIINWSHAGLLLPTSFDGKGYSLADVDASAAILEDVYRDEQLRREMGTNGFKIWLERFTWEKIASEYERLYLKLFATGYGLEEERDGCISRRT